MAEKFKKGDIVVLKSGGPKMTVDSDSTGGGLYAIWFAGAKRERAHFSVESLVLVDETMAAPKKS